MVYKLHIYMEIQPNAFCHGTCQNNHSKNRAEIFNHDYKYLLSAERSFPMSDFLFYAVYANYF